jgi:hypothetical protein
VIVLDATAADQAAIGAYTALDLGDRQSEMVAFGRSDAAGAEEMTIVDSGDLDPQRAERISDQRREQLRRVAARRAAGAVVEDIEADRPGGSDVDRGPAAKRLAELKVPRATTACTGDRDLCDASALHYTVHVESPSGVAAMPAGHWTADRASAASGPAPGRQEASWQTDQYFDVYLDNDGRPQGDNQVVAYRFYGLFNPARGNPQTFFQMNGPFRGGVYPSYIPERAWWTGTWAVSAEPAAQRLLTLGDYQPTTPVTEGSYTTGAATNVGITIATPDGGAGIGVGWTVSQSQSVSIPSWSWESRADPASQSLRWLFGSRTPCDARQGADHSGCFQPPTLVAYGEAKAPSETSRSAAAISATGQWKACTGSTAAPCSAPLSVKDGPLRFALGSPVTLVDSYCFLYGHHDDQLCSGWQTTTVNQQPTTASIDPSVVNPCPDSQLTDCEPVDSIKFLRCKRWEKRPGERETCAELGEEIGRSGTADGDHNEKVVGQVTLTKPVTNPNGATIVVTADSVNVQLERATATQGSLTRGAVEVKQGSKEGRFVLVTNANAIQCRTNALVRAFFAGPADAARLRVAGSPGSCTT